MRYNFALVGTSQPCAYFETITQHAVLLFDVGINDRLKRQINIGSGEVCLDVSAFLALVPTRHYSSWIFISLLSFY